MQHGADARGVAQRRPRAVRREATETDDDRWPQRVDGVAQRRVADLLQRPAHIRRQLVGRQVRAALTHEDERTPVPHEEALEERLGRAEAIAHPAPYALAAHFAARAVEAADRALR